MTSLRFSRGPTGVGVRNPRATGSGSGSRQAARGGGGPVVARRPHLSPGGGSGGGASLRDTSAAGVVLAVLLGTGCRETDSSSKAHNTALPSWNSSLLASPACVFSASQSPYLVLALSTFLLPAPFHILPYISKPTLRVLHFMYSFGRRE